ncbi:MAG: type II/IV secretion system protein [Sedimentisphaerales bacterium]|nr:type II/IV secretion system protein [Sedimentisphaerales bacterium]
MTDFRSYLAGKKILSSTELEALEKAQPAGHPLYYAILAEHPMLELAVWQSLAEFLQVELVDASKVRPDANLVNVLPARLAHELSIVPLRLSGDRLEIALADPQQFEKCEELTLLIAEQTGRRQLNVVGRLALPSDITRLTKQLYGIGAETVQDVLKQPDAGEITVLGQEVVDLSAAETPGEDGAIIRFVNQLLLEAVKIGASDIHLEPFENELRVRFRLDGILQRESVPERLKHLEPAIISRLKILANLDIAEKRLPQDGQIRLRVLGRPIDVRVSVLPTMFGQGLALRLLDRQLMFRRLDSLGMPEDYRRLFGEVLALTHGVILVTGPTGSGKTTTLYASLHEINREDRKIVTVEDPIEYQFEGVSQIQVKPAIGLTFAHLLRSILRHDPDIIMVGEIRDRETAEIAISAAMTGHLVFSTLHTNDAPSAPVRLLEMGLEPFLVSNALEAVIAQRLVRMLCPHCKERDSLSEQLPERTRRILAKHEIFRARGCRACRETGYQGRTALFEMFTLDDTIRAIILERAPGTKIGRTAAAKGMRTLFESGLEKVREGVTSLAEVYRVAREETIEMSNYLGLFST